jgi:CubicO group peptidase (beta-lactamase class C family)
MGENVEAVIEDLRSEIPSRMKKEGIPGLAMALVSKGGTEWLGCFGHTDRSNRRRVDNDTLFSLQSTTKTVTTVAFLLAVQDGLVELDDALVDHYPEFHVNSRFGEYQHRTITFRHLLSHSSGLAREGRRGGVFEDGSSCTWEEHIGSINGSWLKFPVGRHQSYSNAGMDMTAYVLEKIMGKPYPEYVQSVLGDPLGVRFHFITTEVCENPNSAKGYLGSSESICATPVGLGCGHAHLSIEDQAKFVGFLLNRGAVDGRRVLETKYVEMMRSTEREGGYGLGTFVAIERGLELPHHPGGGFGLASEMYWVPEYDAGVAVFCNQEYQGYLSELTKRVMHRLMEMNGATLEPARAPLAEAPVTDVSIGRLGRLVGVYGGILGDSTVKVSRGNLILEYSGKDVELSPRSEKVFVGEEPRGVVFGLDRRGEPVHMKLHSSGGLVTHMDYLGRPQVGLGPNREEWRRFEGLYCMSLYGDEALFGAVKVEDDGYLHMRLWGDDRLYENEGSPDVFFLFKGETVVFEGDRLLFDNTVCRRIGDPVAYLKELEARRGSKVPSWIIDKAVGMLGYLGRGEEAETVILLKGKD